jgi:hypothetical protein
MGDVQGGVISTAENKKSQATRSPSSRFQRLTGQGIGRSLDFSRISAPVQRLGSGALVLNSSLFVE